MHLDARLLPYWHTLFDVCPALLKFDPPDGTRIFRTFMTWAYRRQVILDWTFHQQVCRWLLESDYRFRIDAIDYAVEKTGFDLPEEFLKRWLLSVNKEITPEQLDKEFGSFIKDMKWQLIRNKIARANELKVTEEELMSEAMAVTRNQFNQYGLYYATDDQIAGYARELLKKEEDARRLADRILDTKVTDFIRSNVKPDEKKVTTEQFNKLFEKA